MAIRIPVVAFMKEMGQDWREYTADRLDKGLGLKGRLARKRIPNGRPLGYHKTKTGVPGRVRKARIKATKRGFTVFVGSKLRDRVFHYGRGGKRGNKKHRIGRGTKPIKIGSGFYQHPRPFAGFTAAWDQEAFRKWIKFIEMQGDKIGPKKLKKGKR